MNGALPKLRLGDSLINQGVATSDQIELALQEQKKCGDRLGGILVRFGFASENDIRDVLSQIIGRQTVSLDGFIADSEVVALVPEGIARKHRIVPLTHEREISRLTVAMADTREIVALDQLRLLLGRGIQVQPVLASTAEIDQALDRCYGFALSLDAILDELESGVIAYDHVHAANSHYSHPFVRLVNALLVDTVRRSASDLHIEPEEWFVRIRYRIDGVMHQIRNLHRKHQAALVVRFKVMAGLDIAETRIPQDGRITLPVSGRAVDFRISTFPTLHGENIVLRVLDQRQGPVALEQLGLQADELTLLKSMVVKPAGLMLVTGPTGSGKSTTLYAILNYLNHESVHIMTLEDPVEYHLPRIRQTSIGPAARMDFAVGLRALMRQDPDIILLGEIRDEETARMAMRASLTGHKVLSTLHTSSALGAIPRLFDLGLPPDLLSDLIIGVMGQRLVRKLCANCRKVCDLSHQLLPEVSRRQGQHWQYRAAGCPACNNTGYQGRLVIAEMTDFDEGMDEIIARRGTHHELQRHAATRGFRTMAQAGVDRILDGSTSLEEVLRVIDLSGMVKGDYRNVSVSLPGH